MHKCGKGRYERDTTEYEKQHMTSTESAEEESGFSSLNSFQEVGVPHFQTNGEFKEDYKKHILQENGTNLLLRNGNLSTAEDGNSKRVNDIELWHVPKAIAHKRSNSIPNEVLLTDKPLKVLWV